MERSLHEEPVEYGVEMLSPQTHSPGSIHWDQPNVANDVSIMLFLKEK